LRAGGSSPPCRFCPVPSREWRVIRHSVSASRVAMRIEEHRAIHLSDYRAPDFHIETAHLDFALEPKATKVTSRLVIARKGAPDAPLRLDGEAQTLLSVTLDGHALHADAYQRDDKSLTIASVPDRFTLE